MIQYTFVQAGEGKHSTCKLVAIPEGFTVPEQDNRDRYPEQTHARKQRRPKSKPKRRIQALRKERKSSSEQAANEHAACRGAGAVRHECIDEVDEDRLEAQDRRHACDERAEEREGPVEALVCGPAEEEETEWEGEHAEQAEWEAILRTALFWWWCCRRRRSLGY